MYTDVYSIAVPINGLAAAVSSASTACGDAPTVTKRRCAEDTVRSIACSCIATDSQLADALVRELCGSNRLQPKGDHPMTKTLSPEPIGLDELVSYQDESVVSNTLHKDAAGTITAFAFDAGEGLSEHTAPFDAFLQVYDGEAEVTIDGKVHRVATENLIRLPANVPHAVHAVTRFKMLLTMMRSS